MSAYLSALLYNLSYLTFYFRNEVGSWINTGEISRFVIVIFVLFMIKVFFGIFGIIEKGVKL